MQLILHTSQTRAAFHSCCRRGIWNNTKELCTTFIATCRTCVSEKFIIEDNERKHCLISMIECSWIYSTGELADETITVLSIIKIISPVSWLLLCYFSPGSEPRLLPMFLSEIFGSIWFPIVLHADTRKEFTAKVILDLIKEIASSCTSVTGRQGIMILWRK
jgi:hypothetical protein